MPEYHRLHFPQRVQEAHMKIAFRRGLGIFLALLAVVAAAPGADAQQHDPSNTEREQMAEIVRKGEAKEAESGYCATLDWPIRASLDPFYAFLGQGRAGGIYLAKLQTGSVRGCSYYRMIGNFTNESGQTCACTVGWACNEGGNCVVSRATWCSTGGGRWTWGQESPRCARLPTN
jgi:hypothetical protein